MRLPAAVFRQTAPKPETPPRCARAAALAALARAGGGCAAAARAIARVAWVGVEGSPQASQVRAASARASRRRALRALTRQAGEQYPPFRAQRDLHDHVAAHLDFSPQPEATKVLAGDGNSSPSARP